ncbi:MAG: hypothetical protein Q9163_003604, partial [Psora crenata]
TIAVHGVEATGKSLTIDAVLKAIDTPSATIRVKECITTRHLLERTISSVKEALERKVETRGLPQTEGRCESISAFVAELQRLLEGIGRFVLVFDNIDRQREAAPTLLPALARLGEIIPKLSVILVMSTAGAHPLHRAGVPYLHFPPYTRDETLSILSKSPMPLIMPEEAPWRYKDEDTAWLWQRFLAAAWDSFGQAAARDIVSFRRVCEKLWPPFIRPVQDGHYGPREFSKLLVKNKALLQGEAALADTILTPSAEAATATHSLPYIPTHLLIAAYLASYNPAKHDITLFSKSSLSKRRKRGGGTALTPHRASKHRKMSRRLLGPQAFLLERFFAIFHAIVEGAVKGGGADVMCQFATLVGLRLVLRAGAGAGAGDILEGGGKWKVNVGYDFVRDMARRVRFDIDDYLMD